MKTTKQEHITRAIWGLWGVIALVAVISLGCTKQRPFDKVDTDISSASEKTYDKDKYFNSSVRYLYVPSSLNSTRTTEATFPMYMGKAKIVKLELAEKVLRVVEVDSESQFNNNPVNKKPVLTIPISHVDFRCATDSDGQCTNKEEEDTSKPWASRRYIRLLVDQMAVQEINFLPIELKNLFSACHNVVGSNFESMSIEEDAINLGFEKTYKSEAGCVSNFSDLSDLTFRVVYKYSLVKLDKIKTPEYKSLTYSRHEENTFGFFDTDTLELDRDNNSTEQGRKKYINRWLPTKSVVYYLSENFNKPEYATIKKTTYEAVESINNSLKLAGTQLRIDLRDAPANLNPGDLRVNTIVMVEDPVNYGILGYGPTAANPETGEIVHGRTAMYLGVMKTGLKRSYEELVKEYLLKKSAEAAPQSSANKSLSAAGVSRALRSVSSVGTNFVLHPSLMGGKTATHKNIIEDPVGHSFRQFNDINKIIARAERQDERKLSLREIAQLEDNEKIQEHLLSVHCYYSLDKFNVNAAIDGKIDEVIEEVGAKPWQLLSSEEKDKVINTLLPFVWRPVLIHELGHNLNLRHNFNGSEDKNNFYTDDELKEMGATRKFAYSSVMDYGYRTTNELQVMGKYDIAALRYAYAEQVEVLESPTEAAEAAASKFVSIDEFRKNPDLNIKRYRYCTDEHVDVNPGCKRFDEGTSLTEIAQHWINSYEENYFRRNFRNGADSFSVMDDPTYIRRLRLTFDSLRANLERYESIKKDFGIADNDPVWDDPEAQFLKDLKAATRLAGEFFIKVLQTPDTMCALAEEKAPNQIVALWPIQRITLNAISCFDQENLSPPEGLISVGQAGKSFQSRKDPNSTNAYADQIDVRGIWIDKMLAVNALTGRLTGISSFDEYTDNYLDVSDMRDQVQSALSALLLDEVVAPVVINTISGESLTANMRMKFYSHIDRLNGHKILNPLHSGVRKAFQIPHEGIDFQPRLAQQLKSNLESANQLRDETSLLNSIIANAGLPLGGTPKDYLSTDIGLTRIFVHSKSKVAAQLITNRETVKLLSTLSKEQLDKIKAGIARGARPGRNASAAEVAAYKLGVKVIEKFQANAYQNESYYELMLGALL